MNIEVSSAIPNAIRCPCCGQQVPDAELLLCDNTTSTITNGAVTIRLTVQQYKLAQYLIRRYPMTVKKDDLYDAVFADHGGGGPDLKIVDVVVCKIRPKMAQLGLIIETAWGVGYRLIEADPSMAGAIKEEGLRMRAPGTIHRWRPEHDKQAKALLKRKLKITAIASIMKLPYMTVERNVRRLQSTT